MHQTLAYEEMLQSCEQLVQSFTYAMLVKVVDRSAHDGELNCSGLPCDVNAEYECIARLTHDHHPNNNLSPGDAWILENALNVLQTEGAYAIEQYHTKFQQLIMQLRITNEYAFAYESFVQVAKQLIHADISWPHIVALLCFGVEIAVFVFEQGQGGLKSFLKKIDRYILDFFVKEEILDWIIEHGGWITMIDFFDDPYCPQRTNHLLAAMAFSELTHVETWSRRLLLAAVSVGVVTCIWHRLSKS